MGTPIPLPTIPDPVPPGDFCDSCWGPGGLFGVGPTPESILVTVFGIKKGPNWGVLDGEPLEGEFTLDQNVVLPCLYRGGGGGSLLQVLFLSNATGASIVAPSAETMFFYNQLIACNILLDNEEDNHFVGGTVKITIPKVI